MWPRIAGLTILSGGVALLLACSPNRDGDVPVNTPTCTETCEAAWTCGGVPENDLAACQAGCDDEIHAEYRICVSETACETMFDCKVYAPFDEVPPDPEAESDSDSE